MHTSGIAQTTAVGTVGDTWSKIAAKPKAMHAPYTKTAKAGDSFILRANLWDFVSPVAMWNEAGRKRFSPALVERAHARIPIEKI